VQRDEGPACRAEGRGLSQTCDDDDDDDDDDVIPYPIFRVILKIEGGPQRSDLIAHHCRASKHPASEIRKVKKCLPSF
jgi:hypothetical protein